MLNSKNERELAYIVRINDITPMNADRLECAHINGWRCVVGKGEFKAGDLAVFFEIDSKLPEVEPFTSMEFLKSKHYKIKSQKIRGVISQGLIVPVSAFNWEAKEDGTIYNPTSKCCYNEGSFLTEELRITYAAEEDNHRKHRLNSNIKYNAMAARHKNLFKRPVFRWLMRREWGKKFLFFFLGKKRDNPKDWPVGRFPGVPKADQERCENMPWIINDKTPFIRTQKCDGSSGTYILERKKFGRYEFYVCSRNVRMMDENQDSFCGTHNYYWEVAKKYDIKNKMRKYLDIHKDINFVCWQGEICAPAIQKNPHHLAETHFYCFHWTDSKHGRIDIRDAEKLWNEYDMEVVPIDEELYIMPDDFDEFKKSADGKYSARVCEGNANCAREGYVYYKSNDPTFSFKNVSREYLIAH